MHLMELLHKEYRQLISQLTASNHLLFFTVLLTGSTPGQGHFFPEISHTQADSHVERVFHFEV